MPAAMLSKMRYQKKFTGISLFVANIKRLPAFLNIATHKHGIMASVLILLAQLNHQILATYQCVDLVTETPSLRFAQQM